jgi:hypothetical protein
LLIFKRITYPISPDVVYGSLSNDTFLTLHSFNISQ